MQYCLDRSALRLMLVNNMLFACCIALYVLSLCAHISPAELVAGNVALKPRPSAMQLSWAESLSDRNQMAIFGGILICFLFALIMCLLFVFMCQSFGCRIQLREHCPHGYSGSRKHWLSASSLGAIVVVAGAVYFGSSERIGLAITGIAMPIAYGCANVIVASNFRRLGHRHWRWLNMYSGVACVFIGIVSGLAIAMKCLLVPGLVCAAGVGVMWVCVEMSDCAARWLLKARQEFAQRLSLYVYVLFVLLVSMCMLLPVVSVAATKMSLFSLSIAACVVWSVWVVVIIRKTLCSAEEQPIKASAADIAGVGVGVGVVGSCVNFMLMLWCLLSWSVSSAIVGIIVCMLPFAYFVIACGMRVTVGSRQ